MKYSRLLWLPAILLWASCDTDDAPVIAEEDDLLPYLLRADVHADYGLSDAENTYQYYYLAYERETHELISSMELFPGGVNEMPAPDDFKDKHFDLVRVEVNTSQSGRKKYRVAEYRNFERSDVKVGYPIDAPFNYSSGVRSLALSGISETAPAQGAWRIHESPRSYGMSSYENGTAYFSATQMKQAQLGETYPYLVVQSNPDQGVIRTKWLSVPGTNDSISLALGDMVQDGYQNVSLATAGLTGSRVVYRVHGADDTGLAEARWLGTFVAQNDIASLPHITNNIGAYNLYSAWTQSSSVYSLTKLKSEVFADFPSAMTAPALDFDLDGVTFEDLEVTVLNGPATVTNIRFRSFFSDRTAAVSWNIFGADDDLGPSMITLPEEFTADSTAWNLPMQLELVLVDYYPDLEDGYSEYLEGVWKIDNPTPGPFVQFWSAYRFYPTSTGGKPELLGDHMELARP